MLYPPTILGFHGSAIGVYENKDSRLRREAAVLFVVVTDKVLSSGRRAKRTFIQSGGRSDFRDGAFIAPVVNRLGSRET